MPYDAKFWPPAAQVLWPAKRPMKNTHGRENILRIFHIADESEPFTWRGRSGEHAIDVDMALRFHIEVTQR